MKQIENKKKKLTYAADMLGCVGMLVLMKFIGEWGIACFLMAFEAYALIRTLFTQALSQGTARMFRSRMAKGQYKNAGLFIRTAFLCYAALGVIASVLFFVCSDVIAAKVFLNPQAALAMKILSPILFLSFLNAVCQGYFQGLGTLMPGAIAMFMERFFSFTFAFLLGRSLYGYGQKVAALLHEEKFAYMYGAAGGAVGFLLAALLAGIFLTFVYLGAGRRAFKWNTEGMRLSENGTGQMAMLFSGILLPSLTSLFSRACLTAGFLVCMRGQADMVGLGILYGGFLPIVFFFVLLICFLVPSSQSSVVLALRREEYKMAKNYLTGGIQAIFFSSLFLAVMNLVLSPQLMQLFFDKKDYAGYLSSCMQKGFLLLLFLPMAYYFGQVLNAVGKGKQTLVSTFVSFLAFLFVLILGGSGKNASEYALIYAALAFSGCLCIMQGVFLFKHMRYTPEWLRLFAFPVLAVSFAALIVFLIRKALVNLAYSWLIYLLGILIGLFVYVTLLLVCSCIREKDLYQIPGGRFLKKMGVMLHLIKA